MSIDEQLQLGGTLVVGCNSRVWGRGQITHVSDAIAAMQPTHVSDVIAVCKARTNATCTFLTPCVNIKLHTIPVKINE
jgi:hypothetical protein